MMIFTQGESVRWVVIPRLGKRDKMRRVDKGEFVLRQPYSEPASDALIVVEFYDPPAKRRAATRQLVLRRVLGDRRAGTAQIYSRFHEMRGQL